MGVRGEGAGAGHLLVRVWDALVLHTPVRIVEREALLLQVANHPLGERAHLWEGRGAAGWMGGGRVDGGGWALGGRRRVAGGRW